MRKFDVSIVGATGLVGRMMMKVLEERHFPVNRLIPYASNRESGRTVEFHGKKIEVIALSDQTLVNHDIALFSAGSKISCEWASKFAERNIYVIDNSSAFRMEKSIPLIVPQVNSYALDNSLIIANPNCSTIQLIVAIGPIHKIWPIRRIFVSTYQAVSGAGRLGVVAYEDQKNGGHFQGPFTAPIFANAVPQIGDFLVDGFCTEEMKLLNETRKILDDNSISVIPHVVRVPVVDGHAESVTIEFDRFVPSSDIIEVLSDAPSVEIVHPFPTQLECAGRDEVFVGRIRNVKWDKRFVNMWIVADNLRRGAATNAVEIAEIIADRMEK
jgi:aspartate-semialdehyde dehydrogenase